MIYSRTCKLCNKPFKTNSRVKKYCDRIHYGKCEVCGCKYVIQDVHYPQRTCSDECRGILRTRNAQETSLKLYGVKNAGFTLESQAKINATCRKKYGVDWTGQSEIQKQHVKETFEKNGGNPMQREECRNKAKATCLERYGAESVLSKDSTVRDKIIQSCIDKYGTSDPGNLPEFREKAKQTSLKNWGVEYFFQSEEGKKAMKQGMLEKYGVDHPMHSEFFINKMRETFQEKYGVDWVSRNPDSIKKLSETVMQRYGVPYFCMHERCKQAQNIQPSKLNLSFSERLNKLIGLECDYEYVIDRKAFDLRIEERKVLIEIDPTYTHCTVTTKYGQVSPDYHKQKTLVAENAGYRCIHVFDWDDQVKIMSLLAPKETIYARKCIIKKVEKEDVNMFLHIYHLQDSCRGQDLCYGLYYNEMLVELMTFGKPRYNSSVEWELLRLCTCDRFKVVGGSSKLFSAFIKEINPSSIVSYCDRSKFSGDVYYKLGFELADEGTPSKHWSKGTKHITDNLLRQRGFDQLFGTTYGKGTSNEELMLNDGWLPIYDCGQARFEWRTR